MGVYSFLHVSDPAPHPTSGVYQGGFFLRPDPEFESKNCVPLFWFLMFDKDEEHFATVESYQGTHRRRYFRVERVIALARLEAT